MKKVKGKIVYCLGSGSQDYTIDRLQGAGTIMAVDAPTHIAIATLIAGTFVVPEVGIKIDQYINSTKY